MSRRLAVFTSGRQDYGILRSTCLLLERDPRFQLQLVVVGMHLEERYGFSIRDIEADALPVARCLETARDRPEDECAVTVARVAQVLRELRPEAFVLAGDRSEAMAAALAATLARVPIVHLHGGEETEGAIDNALRHAITKLAHLHLVSHPLHAGRVLQMGEAASAVHVVGAPSLDNLHREDLPDRAGLERDLGSSLPAPLVLVTYHPATLGGDPGEEARTLVEAMAQVPATYVVTLPNSDEGGPTIRQTLGEFARGRAHVHLIESLGPTRYFGFLRCADAILGNSSSALIEAPLFQLPAVNVGNRQRGRLRGPNVIEAPCEPKGVAAALRSALDPSFRRGLAATTSPFGDGRSAPRIVEILAAWSPPVPPRKSFLSRVKA